MSAAKDVAAYWESALKRRAYADGYDAYTSGAGNPYTDVTACTMWRSGFDAAKRRDPQAHSVGGSPLQRDGEG